MSIHEYHLVSEYPSFVLACYPKFIHMRATYIGPVRCVVVMWFVMHLKDSLFFDESTGISRPEFCPNMGDKPTVASS